MAGLASINVKFSVDLKSFSTSMQSALRDIDKFGQKMQAVGRGLSTYVTLPLLAAGAASIKFASDFEESSNKVDVAFGDSADSVKEFSKTTLESFGISKGSALEMASLFGDMATSMGLPQDEAAKMSKNLVGLAGDLSSFKNIGIDQAQTALAGIFTGESESLKKLGIVLTEASLQEYAHAQGIRTKVSDMGQAEKVQLRYNYILAKTTNAQGDFERTGGGAANQMRIFQETLKEIATSLGEVILPVFTKIITKINGWLKAFNNLSDGTRTTIVVIAGIAAAIGPLVLAIGAVASAIPAIVAGFSALTGVIGLSLGPITLIVAALAAVAYVVVNNWAPIKKTLVDIANYFVDLYNNSMVFRGAIEYIALAFKNLWAEAKLTFNNILAVATYVGNNIFNYFKTLGGLIKAVLTLDWDGFKKAMSTGLSSLVTDTKAFFKRIVGNSKDAAKEVAGNVKTALSNTLNGNKIAKIVIPEDKVDASAVEKVVKKAVEKGAAPVEGIKVGSIAFYEKQISDLQKLQKETSTTAAYYNALGNEIEKIQAKIDRISPKNELVSSLKPEGFAGGYDPKAKLTTKVDIKNPVAKDEIAKLAEYQDKMQEIQAVSESVSSAVASAFDTMGTSLVASMGLASTGFEGFAGKIIQTGLALISNLIQQVVKNIAIRQAESVANSVAGATASGAASGPLAIFTTPAFIATAVSGVIAAFAAIPKFTTGGIQGGSSFYGDKILARINSGEMITNSNQQKAIWGAMNAGSNVNVNLGGEFVLDGNKLRLLLDRTDKRNNRIG